MKPFIGRAVEEYKQQISTLILKTNLLEVQIRHKKAQIDILFCQLDQKSHIIKQKDKQIHRLEFLINNLQQKNKWLEQDIDSIKKGIKQNNQSQIQTFIQRIVEKEKQVKRLQGIIMTTSLENQKYEELLKQKNMKILVLEKQSIEINHNFDLSKLKYQQTEAIEQRLNSLLKTIEVKKQNKYNTIFTSRVFKNPANSIRDISRSYPSIF